MTETEAIKILNRMGIDYGPNEIAEVMSGDMWVPTTDEEWRHYFSSVG